MKKIQQGKITAENEKRSTNKNLSMEVLTEEYYFVSTDKNELEYPVKSNLIFLGFFRLMEFRRQERHG